MALGLRNYWDTYFAGRAAPLGPNVPAEVVHAVFYNFTQGEVARHVPKVWELTTPEAALAARERGCVAGLRGRATRERIEALTDRLAEPPYDGLTPAELDQLITDLTPISVPIKALLPF